MDALGQALKPHALTPPLAKALDDHLVAYREAIKSPSSPNERKRFRQRDLNLIAAAKRLQKLIASLSTRDIFEAVARGSSQSLFEEQLAERIAEWKTMMSSSPRKGGPGDWNRPVLVWRALHAFDAAGVMVSSHRDAPMVRALRVLLTIADRRDGRRITPGNMRLVLTVIRDYKTGLIWGRPERLHRFYERNPLWPKVGHKTKGDPG